MRGRQGGRPGSALVLEVEDVVANLVTIHDVVAQRIVHGSGWHLERV